MSTSNERPLHFDTLALHAGYTPAPTAGARAVASGQAAEALAIL
ncbi:hypothetical protein [Myxococcus sp. Y35]